MRFAEACDFIAEKIRTELPAYLTYHNLEHTLDVYRAAERLATLEGIDEYEKKLLLTAAMFHDSGYLESSAEHEELSCGIAAAYLPRYDYTPGEIDRICRMIRATKLPQSPENLLEQVLCDADLDYLGREDFSSIGRRFFTELCAMRELGEEEWMHLQVQFLKSHQYFTAASVQLRKQKKEENLQFIQHKIRPF